MKSENILAVVPARGGSKGVRKKNIRLLGGKPLISWTLEAAKGSKYISRIIISTEDEEIADIGRTEDVQVIRRPPALAQDDSPTLDVLMHALGILKADGYTPDVLLLLQCTSPFRTGRHIDEAIGLFLPQVHTFDSLISVVPNEHPPQWSKTITADGRLCDLIDYNKDKYSRRQDFEPTYRFNGAIYIGTPEKIIQNKGFAAKNTLAYCMDYTSSIDIDTESDFCYAEYLCSARRNDPHSGE